jgi:Acyltransferase
MQGRLQRWLMIHGGAFSVYREGMDREALKSAIQILVAAKRPLVLFPEGVVSRANDRLLHLMDGTAFIARNAAKQRAEQSPAGQVVVHPVAVRYFFLGDLQKTVAPVLEEIERRLTWTPSPAMPIEDRIAKIGEALLALKELEYAGGPQPGNLTERLAGLIDRILVPLETEWLKGKRESNIIGRVKALRTAILPDMIADKVDEPERARRWKQLADVYLAQQLSNYPPDYFTDHTPVERVLETVERFEEDLTDTSRVHRPLHATIEIGEAIPVPPGRERGAASDPIMTQLRHDLETMLEQSRARRPVRASS